jgi:coenzyme F420-reducing hydrogenase alpha subunit
MSPRTIKVDYLARVEGEGALTIKFKGDEVRSVELRIFEPPRLFEAFLRGRSVLEVPDITARICGICPVAYQMSSCHALEDALGMRVEGSLRALRRLLYCGEWIESHALHVFMLHAPDFLGFPDAISLAKKHPDVVKNSLRIKKAGNAILATLGGRAVHPVNVRVGGFYRAPTRAELHALVPELTWARGAMAESLRWLSTFAFPEFERDYEFVSLAHPDEYPMNEGRIVSNKGLDLAARDYDATFEELQVPYSNALQSRVRGRADYVCGPLARWNANFERWPETTRKLAREIALDAPCSNPFKGLLVRGLEISYAIDEALGIVESYDPPPRPFEALPTRAGTGFAATEAPRGLLYHRYTIDARGSIEDAKIVPPTSQNQLAIERDLFALGAQLVALPHDEATLLAEKAVRSYDPCISCATHFLELKREELP